MQKLPWSPFLLSARNPTWMLLQVAALHLFKSRRHLEGAHEALRLVLGLAFLTGVSPGNLYDLANDLRFRCGADERHNRSRRGCLTKSVMQVVFLKILPWIILILKACGLNFQIFLDTKWTRIT